MPDRKISFALYVIIALTLLCLAYLAWELYWIRSVDYAVVKWHTHLMVYVYLEVIVVWFFYFLSRKGFSQSMMNYFLLCSSLIFALFLVEGYYVITGSNKTYIEKVAGYYQSLYKCPDKTYYHLYPAGKPHWISRPEYSYIRPTNSKGFGDLEWPVAKKPGEKRILALGDSFTEGDGAPFDSSYVALLKPKLATARNGFYVMNAGICGSDPFNNYINLRDLLLIYKPDVIIQSLGSGDLNSDICTRGGMERFQKDGTVQFHRGPWWEPIYAVSYISRIYFKYARYNELLQKPDLTAEEIRSINQNTEDLFNQYTTLCRQNGMRLFVVLHPQREEVKDNKYNYDLSPLLQYFTRNRQITVIDLLPSYRTYIARKGDSVANYYWKNDGHHNAAGYEMMAETTFQNIYPLLSESRYEANDNIVSATTTRRAKH